MSTSFYQRSSACYQTRYPNQDCSRTRSMPALLVGRCLPVPFTVVTSRRMDGPRSLTMGLGLLTWPDSTVRALARPMFDEQTAHVRLVLLTYRLFAVHRHVYARDALCGIRGGDRPRSSMSCLLTLATRAPAKARGSTSTRSFEAVGLSGGLGGFRRRRFCFTRRIE